MTPTVVCDLPQAAGSSDDGHPHKKIKLNEELRDMTDLEVTTKVPDPAHDSIDIDDTPGHFKSKNIDDSQNLSDPFDPFNGHGESLTVDDPPPFKKRKIVDPSQDDIVIGDIVQSSGFGESIELENGPPKKRYRVTRKQPG